MNWPLLYGHFRISCLQIEINILIDILVTCGVQYIVKLPHIIEYTVFFK